MRLLTADLRVFALQRMGHGLRDQSVLRREVPLESARTRLAGHYLIMNEIANLPGRSAISTKILIIGRLDRPWRHLCQPLHLLRA